MSLELRLSNFCTITRARTLPQSTDVTQDIWRTAGELLAQALPTQPVAIRLLGVGISAFAGESLVQKTLIDDEGQKKQHHVDSAVDAVRVKFGNSALNRGSGLLHDAHHRPEPRPEK